MQKISKELGKCAGRELAWNQASVYAKKVARSQASVYHTGSNEVDKKICLYKGTRQKSIKEKQQGTSQDHMEEKKQ